MAHGNDQVILDEGGNESPTDKPLGRRIKVLLLVSAALTLLGVWMHYDLAKKIRAHQIRINSPEYKRMMENNRKISKPGAVHSYSGALSSEEKVVIWRRVWVGGGVIFLATAFYASIRYSRRQDQAIEQGRMRRLGEKL